MKRLVHLVTHFSWDALIFFLPVTSLPLISRLAGGTDVAPLSAVFLAILALIWLVPKLLRGEGIPTQSTPLLVFFLVALASSLVAFFLPIPSFTNEPIWKNELTSLITLVIGVSFFLVTSLWISDEGKLERFFKIVNFSGGLALLYALIQGVFVVLLNQRPAALGNFQDLISSSQTLFVGRVNGLAFEPSWLAHQLNMFYIPIWLGLSIKKISFHKFKLAGISVENALLAASLVVMFLTKSRIGWLALLAYAAYLFLRLMGQFRQRISQRVIAGQGRVSFSRLRTTLFNIGFWLLLILILMGVVFLAGWVLTKVDPRMADLFDIQRIQQQGILGWAFNLLFAERLIYWISGYSLFAAYPILGVGLGNSGYFMPHLFESIAYASPEILRIFLSGQILPNPKNLWVRLLAETGIAGFSVFVSWLWVEWKTARANERMSTPLAQAVGIMGQIVLVGLILEGFSLDTFALPYYWMTLGVVVAAFRIYSGKMNAVQTQAVTEDGNTLPTGKK
jgi:flagellar biogenesis protein FliO